MFVQIGMPRVLFSQTPNHILIQASLVLCSFLMKQSFSGHPRYRTLVQNIRARRGRKVIINIPILKDVNTPDPFVEKFTAEEDVGGEAAAAAKADHVYMDAMGFGMGCCCLQVTFQQRIWSVDIFQNRMLIMTFLPLLARMF